LIAALPDIADDSQRPDNFRVRLRGVESAEKLGAALELVVWEDVLPAVSAAALAGLKFSEVLPPELAVATIAERLADHAGARCVAGEARVLATST
jgi:ATP-dependent Lhr-like helicase